jgi:putative hydrolase of the HAD superfamily
VRAYDAVTFDFWNTLVAEDDGALRDRRIERVGGVLDAAGVPLSRPELEALFERSWQDFVAAWHAGRQYTAEHAVEHVLEQTGAQLAPAVRDELVEAILHAGRGAGTRLTPNVAATLDRLREAGVRIGIICDVGLTPSPVLRDYLDGHGVLDRFDHWSFSDEVGVYKPDARIFAHACAGLGDPAPERTAHVGDLRRTDVAGARAAGWTAVRYTGVADDAGFAAGDAAFPEADHVIADHAALPGVLGL